MNPTPETPLADSDLLAATTPAAVPRAAEALPDSLRATASPVPAGRVPRVVRVGRAVPVAVPRVASPRAPESAEPVPIATAVPAPGAPPSPRSALRRFWALATAGPFLFISILVHLLFGAVAAVLIVQTINARKLTFVSAPPSVSRSAHALEHRVQMARKQKSMSAPAQPKRVTSTAANAKIALPAMPAMSTMTSTAAPMQMAGVGGPGFGMGAGGGGGGGAGGGGMPLFGFRGNSKGMVGNLYDLKQDPARRSTNMNIEEYTKVVSEFVKGGFNLGVLARYYKATVTLTATQLFTPAINANEAPKAFGVEKEVQPKMWIAFYHAKVTPPESGTYHFVGFGDDVLVVAVNGRVVLDRGYICPSGVEANKLYPYNIARAGGYHNANRRNGHGESLPVQVEAGESYDLKIVIGERPGGYSMFQLLLEKEGVSYAKDATGNPILPIFRLAESKPVVEPFANAFPPHLDTGEVWKAEPPGVNGGEFSVFDHH